MYKKSLAYPHLAWMLVFVLVPMVIILLYSINILTPNGTGDFSLANYTKLLRTRFTLEPLVIRCG